METITYAVDDEPQTTTDKTLTPRQILSAAGINASTHYLVLLRGNSGEKESYQTKMDETIHIHPQMRFVSVSTGPTTVS
jgi:hypothetical protein